MAVVQLEKKLEFHEDKIVPACLPVCQSECKTKWEDLTLKKMEWMKVLNSKYDDTDNTLKKYELELFTHVECIEEFGSRVERLVFICFMSFIEAEALNYFLTWSNSTVPFHKCNALLHRRDLFRS